jgi:hypothetical protein
MRHSEKSAVPLITVGFGVLLVALGVWGRFGTPEGLNSITSLIPGFVGAPLIVLGLLALKESWLKHCMHLAAMIGLLGFVAAGGRLISKAVQAHSLTAVLEGGYAGFIVGLMTALCGAFVALCVNSFIQARRRRRAREALGNP